MRWVADDGSEHESEELALDQDKRVVLERELQRLWDHGEGFNDVVDHLIHTYTMERKPPLVHPG